MSERHLFGVIMAGGVGSRFWPASTEEKPKQFLDLTGSGKSLLRQTFERLNRFIPTENILVVSNKRYKSLILQELPELNENSILSEPVMRNTAPAVLYAANRIRIQNPNALMLVTPSDHYINDNQTFEKNIRQAVDFASRQNALMTLGIKPVSPHTGYGYIEFNPQASITVKKVQRFTEKPDLETAERFLEQGNFLWNTGIFIWTVKSIEVAFQKYLPDMFERMKSNTYGTEKEERFIGEIFPKLENISVDYGIMEKADNVYVLPAEFEWNDLGSWDALYRQLQKHEGENISIAGKIHARNSKGNLIDVPGKKVIISGLENYSIIEHNDILMIIPLDESQQVKHWREKIKRKK